MATLKFWQGDVVELDYTPNSAVSAGDVVILGDIPCVAHQDIAANVQGALAGRGGAYVGIADGAISAGKRVFWDATNKKFTLTATGNTMFGWSITATTTNGDTIYVIHEPIPNSAAPDVVTLSPAASTANICLVTIQVKDSAGNNITAPTVIDITLSDAATGVGLTATTASGAVAAGASGTDLGTLTSKKALRSMTDATGKYILSITDTAKTGFYVTATVGGRKTTVSAQLVTGNYG
jgi:predicted RecA/RadA family phage recombinase